MSLHVSRIQEGLKDISQISELTSRTRSISLHCNDLNTLAGLNAFKNLQDIVASNNSLNSLGDLSSLSQLTALDLASNCLREIDDIRCLDRLQCLKLSYNQLQSLYAFGKQGSLQALSRLELDHNCIDVALQIRCLLNLSGLRELAVNGQQLTDGQSTDIGAIQTVVVAALPQIKTLDGVPVSALAAEASRQTFASSDWYPRKPAVEDGPLFSPPAHGWPAQQVPVFFLEGSSMHPPQPYPADAVHTSTVYGSGSPQYHLAAEPDLPPMQRSEASESKLQGLHDAAVASLELKTKELEDAKSAFKTAIRDAQLKVSQIRLQAGAVVKQARHAEQEALLEAREAKAARALDTAQKAHTEQLLTDAKADITLMREKLKHADITTSKLSGALENGRAHQQKTDAEHKVAAKDMAENLQSSLMEAERLRKELYSLQQEKLAWQDASQRAGLREMHSEAMRADHKLQGQKLFEAQQLISTQQAGLSEASIKQHSAEKTIDDLQRQIEQLQENVQENASLHKQAIEDAVAAAKQEVEVQEADWSRRESALIASLEEVRAGSETAGLASAASQKQMQLAIQESEQELQSLQASRNAALSEAKLLSQEKSELSTKLKAQEKVIRDLRDAILRLKDRVTSSEQENAKLTAQLAATNPHQTSRLVAEIGTLRERIGMQVNHEAQMRRIIQRMESELQEKTKLLDEQSQMLKARNAEAERLMGSQAHARAEETRLQAHRLQEAFKQKEEQLQDSKDALKVKEAMVDSANESVAKLKASLADARADLQQKQLSCEALERRLLESHGESCDALRSRLRDSERKLRAADGTAQDAEARALSAERHCCTLQETLKDRDEMVKYVSAEVDRARVLFRTKEQKLLSDRDEAKQEEERCRQECQVLQEDIARLKSLIETHSKEQKVKEDLLHKAVQESESDKAQAAKAAVKVAKMDAEMRQLMAKFEKQKSQSTAKMQQLAAVVQELQGL